MEFFTMAFHSLLHFLALFYHRSKTSSWVVILAIFAVAHALNQVELMVVEFRAGGERHAATARGGSILHAVQRFENYFRNPWYMLDMAVMGISLLYFILWYSDLSFSARAALSFNCISKKLVKFELLGPNVTPKASRDG